MSIIRDIILMKLIFISGIIYIFKERYEKDIESCIPRNADLRNILIRRLCQILLIYLSEVAIF